MKSAERLLFAMMGTMKHKLLSLKNWQLAVAGVLIWLAGIIFYAANGFSIFSLGGWVIGLGLVISALVSKTPGKHAIHKGDWKILAALTILFAPFYLLALHRLPVQVNTDEVTIMIVAKQLAAAKNADWFGLSTYFNFPAMIFLVFGKLGQALGGVTLAHMRLIHASFGLSVVPLSYLLFRQLLPKWRAAAATVIIGCSHSLIMLSRMGMRDNSGLVFELLALTLLLHGYKQRNYVATFLGGMATGFGWYTYYPGRVSIVIWLVFLMTLIVIKRRKTAVIDLLKLALVACLGWLMVTAPLQVATTKAPADNYGRQQLLIYPEGRLQQQTWTYTKTQSDGMAINIKNGLSVFNNRISDYANIYANPGHGFVDPLTGILIWIGVLAFVIALWRRRTNPDEWLMLVGLFGLWLSFAFIVNKAPDYTRLLVILPFAAYWAARGLFLIADAIGWLGRKYRLPGLTLIIAAAGIAAILIGNFQISMGFIHYGEVFGNDVGSTGRYVEAMSDKPGHHFYLAADLQNPYYAWGIPEYWQNWLGFFAADNQSVSVVKPANISSLDGHEFTVFISGATWQAQKEAFAKLHPFYQYHPVTPDGRLVAIEVQ